MTTLSAGAAAFEVVDPSAAVRLTQALAPLRTVVLGDEHDGAVVIVPLGESRDGLAVLMRRVERWLADEPMDSIRYAVDGRYYVLEAGPQRSS